MHESDISDINNESRQRKQLRAGTNFSKTKAPSMRKPMYKQHEFIFNKKKES